MWSSRCLAGELMARLLVLWAINTSQVWNESWDFTDGLFIIQPHFSLRHMEYKRMDRVHQTESWLHSASDNSAAKDTNRRMIHFTKSLCCHCVCHWVRMLWVVRVVDDHSSLIFFIWWALLFATSFPVSCVFI